MNKLDALFAAAGIGNDTEQAACILQSLNAEVDSGVSRHYHTVNHVYRIWTDFKKLFNTGESREIAEFALYHDIVYERDAKNEQRSAERYINDCVRYERPVSEYVVQGILASASHTITCSTYPHIVKIMLDLDLAGLADEWNDFIRSTDLIRQEFAFISENNFNIGRVKFFDALLSRDQLYYTHINKQLGARARDNIRQEKVLLEDNIQQEHNKAEEACRDRVVVHRK